MPDPDHDASSTATAYTPIPVDKSLPRPAPTMVYSWKEYNPDATLLYIRSHKEADTHLARLRTTGMPRVFGFDLEWKPTFVKGAAVNAVALVQLASDSVIFLFQITSMQEFPSSLAQLLADPLVVKAGVAIQGDAKKLFDDYKIPIANCVDLSLLARTVDNARWQGGYNSSLGLARLVESYHYRLLGKGKVTRSNWEAVLSPLQIDYASNDAHAGYRLYIHLDSILRKMPVAPNPDWYSFNYFAGQMRNANGFEWHPHNPQYDAGPQPPPRPPREERRKVAAEEANKEYTNTSNPRVHQGRPNRGKTVSRGNEVEYAPNILSGTSEWGGFHDESTPSYERFSPSSYREDRDDGRYNQKRRNDNRDSSSNYYRGGRGTHNGSRGGGAPNNAWPRRGSAPAPASRNNFTGRGGSSHSSFMHGMSTASWAADPPAQTLDWEAPSPPAQAWEAGPSAQVQRTQSTPARARPYYRSRGKGSRGQGNGFGAGGSAPHA